MPKGNGFSDMSIPEAEQLMKSKENNTPAKEAGERRHKQKQKSMNKAN